MMKQLSFNDMNNLDDGMFGPIAKTIRKDYLNTRHVFDKTWEDIYYGMGPVSRNNGVRDSIKRHVRRMIYDTDQR